MGKLKEYIRKKLLARHAFKGKTALSSIKGMKKATVLLDVTQDDLFPFREAVYEYFKENGIAPSFYYFDFRKREKDMAQLSAPADTISRKQLSCCTGKPSLKSFNPLFFKQSDIFVSFVREESYALKYICSIAPASFKVGAIDDPECRYDLVIAAEDNNAMLACMKDILPKIS